MKWHLAFAFAVLALPAFAVLPNEQLADPVLESRARQVSQGLRCLVCQNESIDESHADLAHDVRVLPRERITAGDSDAQATAYIVARYGGSISAEHGLGVLRRDEAARYKSPVEMGLMRALKTALDPDGLMNPGKLLA